jgi:hypothetical protein
MLPRIAGETVRVVVTGQHRRKTAKDASQLTCSWPKTLVVWQRFPLTCRIRRIEVDQDRGGLVSRSQSPSAITPSIVLAPEPAQTHLQQLHLLMFRQQQLARIGPMR